MDQFTRELRKIKFHINLLKETINPDVNPIEALILSLNWDEDNFKLAQQIFKKFDSKLAQTGEISCSEFEFELRDSLKIKLQDVKAIINAFYTNSQWKNICKLYAEFNGSEELKELILLD